MRPLKPWDLLFLIPYALVTGLVYGVLAHKLTRDKEPWFTLVMLCGLGITITLLTSPNGIPAHRALWTFAGTGLVYVLLRLLFGRRGAAEMLVVPQVLAVLVLLFWSGYEHARNKALERRQAAEFRHTLAAP